MVCTWFKFLLEYAELGSEESSEEEEEEEDGKAGAEDEEVCDC